MSAEQTTQQDRRRRLIEERTIPFLAVAQGDVAVDLNGRYHSLMARESAMDGELTIQCPDGRWTVEDLERALDGRYEAATRYWAMARFPIGHQVIDSQDRFRTVDQFNTRSAAEYAARQLNAGMARVDSHAIVGCKVVAS